MARNYAFGDYVLDTRRHTLLHGDREISVGERSFGVLKILVENAGRVVERQELIDRVWADVAVSDDSLARAVSDLRSSLGDDPAHPRFIRTVHRRGYLFVAPVKTDEAAQPRKREDSRTLGQTLRITLGFVAAGMLLFAGSMALQFFESRRVQERNPPVNDFSEWRLRALGPTPFTAAAIKPCFSKTGGLLSVVAPDPATEAHSIFLLRPDGGEPLQLTRGIEVRGPSPEFAANDTHILFTSFRSDPESGLVPDVWMVPLPAGTPTLLIENASAASTSPDGRELVYSAVTPHGTSIRVRHQDGTEIEVAKRGFWPRWSPDGEWIAYTTSDPEGGRGTLHIVKPNGSDYIQLTTTPSQLYGLCWTPDSSRVIFASDHGGPTTLWSVDVTGENLVSVTLGPGMCDSPTLSADGQRIVFSFAHRRWFLHVADSAAAPAKQVLETPGVRAAALSPDGRFIALVEGAAAQSPAVSVVDISTNERSTISGLAASAVAWMPDGENLVVTAPAPDGAADWVWLLPIGGGLPEPVMAGSASWDFPRPSPDGSHIAATRHTEFGDELVAFNLKNRTERVIARSSVIEGPRWSPDGQTLAWSGSQRPDDTESGGVWVSNLEEGPPRRLTRNGAWPVWESGGEGLLFGRFLHERGIWRAPFSGGPAELVRDLESEMADLYLEGLDTGRNGRPILFMTARYSGELYVLEPPASP